MRFLLLLFLTSCAASRPSEYRDGAPVRTPVVPPRVGHTPAGAGLPEYFRDPEREPLPRSPHRRPLPPTAEPGIWAGDEPKASSDETPVEPIMLMGIPLPVPVPEIGPVDYTLPNMCGRRLEPIMMKDPQRRLAMNMTYDERECLAALLYEFCAAFLSKNKPTVEAGIARHVPKVVAKNAVAGIDRLLQTATGFRGEKCHSKTHTPAVKAAFKEASGEW